MAHLSNSHENLLIGMIDKSRGYKCAFKKTAWGLSGILQHWRTELYSGAQPCNTHKLNNCSAQNMRSTCILFRARMVSRGTINDVACASECAALQQVVQLMYRI